MTDLMTLIRAQGPMTGAIIGLLVGGLLGLIHFGSLWWNARLLTTGNFFPAAGILVMRFGLLAVVLFSLAKIGALPMLMAGLGLLLMRRVLLRRLGKVI